MQPSYLHQYDNRTYITMIMKKYQICIHIKSAYISNFRHAAAKRSPTSSSTLFNAAHRSATQSKAPAAKRTSQCNHNNHNNNAK